MANAKPNVLSDTMSASGKGPKINVEFRYYSIDSEDLHNSVLILKGPSSYLKPAGAGGSFQTSNPVTSGTQGQSLGRESYSGTGKSANKLIKMPSLTSLTMKRNRKQSTNTLARIQRSTVKRRNKETIAISFTMKYILAIQDVNGMLTFTVREKEGHQVREFTLKPKKKRYEFLGAIGNCITAFKRLQQKHEDKRSYVTLPRAEGTGLQPQEQTFAVGLTPKRGLSSNQAIQVREFEQKTIKRNRNNGASMLSTKSGFQHSPNINSMGNIADEFSEPLFDRDDPPPPPPPLSEAEFEESFEERSKQYKTVIKHKSRQLPNKIVIPRLAQMPEYSSLTLSHKSKRKKVGANKPDDLELPHRYTKAPLTQKFLYQVLQSPHTLNALNSTVFYKLHLAVHNIKLEKSNYFKDFMKKFVSKLFVREVKSGQVIMRTGESHPYFYIIQAGVFKEDHDGSSSTLRKGDFFGQFSFLGGSQNRESTSTVVCHKGEGMLWCISRREFLAIRREAFEKLAMMKFKKMSDTGAFPSIYHPRQDKSLMSSTQLLQLASNAEVRFVEEGREILNYGEPVEDTYYVLQGTLSIFAKSVPSEEERDISEFGFADEKEPHEAILTDDNSTDTFGEFSLLSVESAEADPNKKKEQKQKEELFSDKLEYCIKGGKNCVILVLHKSEAELLPPDVLVQLQANILSTEKELLKQAQRPNMDTLSPSVLASTFVSAGKHISYRYDNITTLLEDELEKQILENTVSGNIQQELTFDECPPLFPDAEFSNLGALTTVGEGSFGKVYLHRYKHAKGAKPKDRFGRRIPSYFALKVIPKEPITRNGWEEKVDCEILAMQEMSYTVGSPFLLNLYYSWSCPRFIYLLLELGEGGDLYVLLRSQPSRRFRERAARYYVSSVVLGLQALHERRIAYRDLKPENLILNRSGHLKIADFGLAKKTLQTYTNCGTPQYTPPEIIAGGGHDHGVDIWALGVLVYELHIGSTPFEGSSAKEIASLITSHRLPLTFGVGKNPPRGELRGGDILRRRTKDLIGRLLHPKPSRRLGYNNMEKLKKHPYFVGSIDWDKLKTLDIPAPFVPDLGPEDDPDIMPRDTDVSLDARQHEKDTTRWMPPVSKPLLRTPKF
eukprot:snap_masked-scaffold_20-processed-gene-2.25-mRNA-1 protein AED:0.39 eAED:0.40 QI:0/-1/0/1/-1/1/1/0/1118